MDPKQYCFQCMRLLNEGNLICPHCGYDNHVRTNGNGYLPFSIVKKRYLIGKALGRGGFGVTYIGMDLSLERRVAIKEYFPSDLVSRGEDQSSLTPHDEDSRISFERGRERSMVEARTIARLNDVPDAVNVYDVLISNNTLYIVMEYIEGETLRARVKRSGGKIKPKEAFDLLQPIFGALIGIHHQGIIHRDVSPENIMFRAASDRAVLLDFGAAHELQPAAESEHSTSLRPGYAPIEQYSHNSRQDARTDEYALCATLYYAITGRKPTASLELTFGDAELTPPSGLGIAIPPAFEGVLMKGLSIQAKDRYADVRELQNAFTDALGQPQMPDPLPNPKPNRNRWFWPAVGVVCVAAVFALALPLLGNKPNPAAAPPGAAASPTITDTPATDGIPELAVVTAPQAETQPTIATVLLTASPLPSATPTLTPTASPTATPSPTVTPTPTAAPTPSPTAAPTPTPTARPTATPAPAAALPISREGISAGYLHSAALKTDGTVVATGLNETGQCDVSGWNDIVSVSAGRTNTVGLKSDGTVVAAGNNQYGECEVTGWKNIVAISAGDFNTLGLKADGTVAVAGTNDNGECNVTGWTDITALCAYYTHSVGLKADGTVVATGDNSEGQCDVSGWSDIIAISAGDWHTVGLRADGTVVAVGSNAKHQCDVSSWKDIVAISAGGYHTVGLKADGTVVAVGRNSQNQCNVGSWHNIVAISAGELFTLGLKKDGTVVAVGYNKQKQCKVGGWANIQTP
ncbi:MAG TPA: protein kinase [Candidatus Limiplasma sp.]|nr:protein kinase [Candidatus Limiplasma sp.]HPS80344.1 protein kinase [Candidatus Limiplasma sp.]